MEGAVDTDEVLDYAIFQISANKNRYEAVICSQGKTEKIASGPLDQLASHLPKAREAHHQPSIDSFRLHVFESPEDFSWFTKSTLTRFLNITNVPEILKNANAIESEMSQLEDTRKFHLTLYTKEHPESAGDGTDIGCTGGSGLANNVTDDSSSLDSTKNELLRAMDLRIAVLKEELASTFNRAAGVTLSMKQVSDIAAFTQYFGALDLRNFLLKYFDLCFKDQNADPSCKQSIVHDSRKESGYSVNQISHSNSPIDSAGPVTNSVSPAKIAQAERHSSTESEDLSDSNEADQFLGERSRPIVRSATPRRSASPMRRIQIGRSGSRRSTALTIKSLNYFPAREKIPFNRDEDGNNSGDEESAEPQKKVDHAVRRMSVQDAISLFESKQKDQTSDIPRWKTAASANKSVLRRWSAGLSNSSSHSSQEIAPDAGPQIASNNLVHGEEGNKSMVVKAVPDFPTINSNGNEGVQLSPYSDVENIVLPPVNDPTDQIMSKAEDVSNRATASAEWNQQKEAELNEMLKRMMESKSSKYRTPVTGNEGYQDSSNEQRGGFYSQYREKRDEKLRAENAGRRAAKDAQFKVMKATLEQSKAQMASRSVIKGKQDSVNPSQRPRRNSSPPVLTKKEAPKPTASRKASPRSPPLPTTRSSSSSGPLPRTGTPPAKSSAGTISTSAHTNRRKPQPPPSPTQPSPRTERKLQPKSKKGTASETKPSLKSPADKQQKTSVKSRSPKTENSLALGEDSVGTLAKPSFYNKVTKKSSVVPLESKPFLKKGTGTSPGVGLVKVKTKVPPSDESLRNSGNLSQPEENKPTPAAEPTTEVLESVDPLPPPMLTVETSIELPPDTDVNHEKTDNSMSQVLTVADNSSEPAAELPVAEMQSDNDMGISSAAWVEVEEHQEVPASCDNGKAGVSFSPELVPLPSSSPRIRHSLSQMLQSDNSEPDIVEWGNAENPPALVYQKDAPKGLKRLLKFARKSKGEANVTGWASPSVFSEGEDDAEESKAAGKRNPDASLRKAALQAKGYGQHKAALSESFDGGNSSKRAMDQQGMHSMLSAQSSVTGIAGVLSSEKLREGHTSATATSTKGTRSFFSLSTFRSGKSSEPKLR